MTQEMIVLKAFVREFSPFHDNEEIINNMTYFELTQTVKEISKEF